MQAAPDAGSKKGQAGFVEMDAVAPALWRPGWHARARWDHAERRSRGIRRRGRTLGLRQVVVDEAGHRPVALHRRVDPRRRHASEWSAQDRRHGIPESDLAAVAEHFAQHHAAAGDRAAASSPVAAGAGEIRRASQGATGGRRARRLRGHAAVDAVRRHAAAGEPVPGAHPRARAADAGRALRRARRLHARGAVGRSSDSFGWSASSLACS